MAAHAKKPKSRHVADEIMTGMRELSRMMDEGKSPVELFTVKTIEVPEASACRATKIRKLRNARTEP